MPRQPKLRKKKIGGNTYWFTEAGGAATYFGNADEVPYEDARRAFSTHVGTLADEGKDRKRAGQSAGELMDLYLDWMQPNRSTSNYKNRRTHLNRFGGFLPQGRQVKVADLPANKVTGADLEGWLAHLASERKLDPQTRLHHETSVRAAWNWGTKHPSPVPHLPPTFRPFSAVERTDVPMRPLTEDDLLTDAEVESLFKAAAEDLDQFHRFGPKTPRGSDDNPYRSFADLLRCYYNTGARTGELAACRVEDVLFRTGQVVLGKHKRTKKERTKTVRHITLNDEALDIFRRHCHGKGGEERVFLNSDRRPWTQSLLPKRFERIKEVSKELKFGEVRDQITIYDFRHLWISEMLMEGNDLPTVARMAGTSIRMIETVYGHFRNEHLREAQDRLDRARQQRRVSRGPGACSDARPSGGGEVVPSAAAGRADPSGTPSAS